MTAAGINFALLIPILFALFLSFGLFFWWKKKTGVHYWGSLAGVICFFLFAQIFEAFFHQVFMYSLGPISAAIMGSPLVFTVYSCLMAGLFEETGRRFGFSVFLRDRNEKEYAVAYGIGHGGFEALILLGATYSMYFLATAGAEIVNPETTAQVLKAAGSIPFSTMCIAIFERISAMLLHIGLSMLMFVAVKGKGKKWLYPVSILLHALADAPASLYQQKIMTSLFVIEGFAFVYGLAVFFLGKKVLAGYVPQPVPARTATAVKAAAETAGEKAGTDPGETAAEATAENVSGKEAEASEVTAAEPDAGDPAESIPAGETKNDTDLPENGPDETETLKNSQQE